MHVRNFQMEDYDDVVALWKQAGLVLSKSDHREGIKRKDEIVIVGVVMGSYDGRRGWINHLAVSSHYKGQKLGTQLVQDIEQRLRDKGCDKVNLLIEPANATVQEFYRRIGYQQDQLIFMEKWL